MWNLELKTWCVVDNTVFIPAKISIRGSAQALVIFRSPSHFNCPSEQGVGSLEGQTDLLALQPLPCPSRSCMGREGPLNLYSGHNFTSSISKG